MSIFKKLFGKKCCSNEKPCEKCPGCNECECVCKDETSVEAEPGVVEEKTPEMQ